jgi:hypothetical protein
MRSYPRVKQLFAKSLLVVSNFFLPLTGLRGPQGEDDQNGGRAVQSEFFSLSFIDERAEKLAWLLDPLLPV